MSEYGTMPHCVTAPETEVVVVAVYGFRPRVVWGGILFLAPVSAGFPSPADDHIEGKLDLNRYLVQHAAATFFVRVVGDSMIGAGIYSGDLLVVDRALEPADGRIVIAVVNGELLVKRIRRDAERLLLVAENAAYAALAVDEAIDFQVWGVVTNVIHPV